MISLPLRWSLVLSRGEELLSFTDSSTTRLVEQLRSLLTEEVNNLVHVLASRLRKDDVSTFEVNLLVTAVLDETGIGGSLSALPTVIDTQSGIWVRSEESIGMAFSCEQKTVIEVTSSLLLNCDVRMDTEIAEA